MPQSTADWLMGLEEHTPEPTFCSRCNHQFADGEQSVDVYVSATEYGKDGEPEEACIDLDYMEAPEADYLVYCIPCWNRYIKPLFNMFVGRAVSTYTQR